MDNCRKRLETRDSEIDVLLIDLQEQPESISSHRYYITYIIFCYWFLRQCAFNSSDFNNSYITELFYYLQFGFTTFLEIKQLFQITQLCARWSEVCREATSYRQMYCMCLLKITQCKIFSYIYIHKSRGAMLCGVYFLKPFAGFLWDEPYINLINSKQITEWISQNKMFNGMTVLHISLI